MRSKVLSPLLFALLIQPVVARDGHTVAPLKPVLKPVATPLPTEQVTPPAQRFSDGYARFNASRPIMKAPVRAAAWVLMDADSGRILAGHNPQKRMFPASTTKTMTALVAIQRGVLNSVVKIGPDPAKTGESSIYLLAGEKFALRDLVRAALIKSANDSCVAIAEAVGGNVPSFVKMMNDTARQVGATGTHFVNPHGLHDPQHYTTALDLARMSRAAMKQPFFRRVVGTREAEIHGNWKIGPRRWLGNRNRLLFRWIDCDGIKTGYTKQAGNCLIASATRRNPQSGRPWRLISVVMKSPDSWSDSYNLLVHQGFEKWQPSLVAHKGEVAADFSVQNGALNTPAVVSRDAVLPLRTDGQDSLEKRVRWETLVAPVAAGQRVGVWEFRSGETLIGNVPLLAQSSIAVAASPPLMPGLTRDWSADSWLRWSGVAALAGSVVLLLAALRIARR